jgi:hypothetical protein
MTGPNILEKRKYEELSRGERSGLQKVIVSGGVQGDVLDATRVNQHGVVVPKIDVRQVLRENALNLTVKVLALLLLGFDTRLVYKFIKVGVGVEAAVRAIRRELGTMKSILEDIWILVAADPAE